jgi:ThiF family
MEIENIDWLNSFLTSQNDVLLIKHFSFESNKIWGRIQMDAFPKKPLNFIVEIPISYPLLENDKKCCRFILENAISRKHINEDRTICLVIPKCFDFKERFELEINALLDWRDKYYIDESEDEKYDYPIVPNQNQIMFLFTDTEHEFIKGENGIVKGKLLTDYTNDKVEIATILITQFGSRKCEWRESKKDEKSIGYYYFIEVEPSENKGILYSSWNDFDSYFTNNFKEKLFENLIQNKSNWNFLFVGFKIKNTEEIHWLAIKIKGVDNFIEKRKYERNAFLYRFQPVHIKWCKTQNASYQRFFGRGVISGNLKNKKVLIIGVGAVGSSLARILTRTGILDLSLSDFDIVATGNLCRGEFNLNDIGLPKVLAMKRELDSISPFVTISNPLFDNLKNLAFETRNQNLKNLSQFDIIFNCTADNELIHAIDIIQPTSIVINLSITNKAKQLMCFVGKNIINQVLTFMPNDIEEKVKFYEGTGCWDWTFQASYFDINAMLHLAIRNINNRLSEKRELRSFIVNYENSDYDNLIINGI